MAAPHFHTVPERRFSRALTGLALVWLGSCSQRAEDCHYTLTCGEFVAATGGVNGDPTGGAGGSTASDSSSAITSSAVGSTSASGGDPATGGSLGIGGVPLETGGVFATGGDLGTGGIVASGGVATGGAPTCAPACTGDKPVCDLSDLTCVECTAEEHCATPVGKTHCNAATRACVECTEEGQCTALADKPHCDVAKTACVQCTNDDQCTDKVKAPYCDLGKSLCVECLDSEDCKSPSAPVCSSGGQCKSCTVNNDCSLIDGAKICTSKVQPDAGVENVCVECTGTQYSACSTDDAGPSFVCDSVNHVCSTEILEHSADVCQACVSDAQCKPGDYCVEQKFGAASVGHFCLHLQNPLGTIADCGSTTNYPFVQKVFTNSIDGRSGFFCSLAKSTCIAYNQFRSTSCGSDKIAPDDTLCGFAHGADSKCAQFGPSNYLCTMACSTDIDCKIGFKCNADGFCKLQ